MVSDIVRLRQTYISGKNRYCLSKTDVIALANPKPNPNPHPTLSLPITLTLTLPNHNGGLSKNRRDDGTGQDRASLPQPATMLSP